MLLTLLLGVAIIVLLAVAGLALWEFLVIDDTAGSAHAISAATSRAPTPPTLDRERRIAARNTQRPQVPPSPPTPIPPPSLQGSPMPLQQDWEEDEEDMPTVMAFPAEYLRDEDDGETVVVNASSYLYELAQLDE